MITPEKSRIVQRLFEHYNHLYLKRSFHAVHLQGSLHIPVSDGEAIPHLVFVSHSSWWDVLLGLYVAAECIEWDFYGVMDQRQLERYRFFRKLGMIGVDRTRIQGAREFLDFTTALLKGKRRALFLTPQGEMVSSYKRPVVFQPGIGYLADRLGCFSYQTLALHYEFWEERQPEAFLSLSVPRTIQSTAGTFNRKAFVYEQQQVMEAQLELLLAAAQRRDPGLFRPLLHGTSGISPVYDTIRRVGALMRGQKFNREHGSIVTPQWGNAKGAAPLVEEASLPGDETMATHD